MSAFVSVQMQLLMFYEGADNTPPELRASGESFPDAVVVGETPNRAEVLVFFNVSNTTKQSLQPADAVTPHISSKRLQPNGLLHG